MINPAKPEIKAAKPRTYTTLWDTILGCGLCLSKWRPEPY
jgi:hypothetical protein